MLPRTVLIQGRSIRGIFPRRPKGNQSKDVDMTAIDFIQPTYSRGPGASARAVRISSDTVVCESCGCRLTMRDSADDAGFTPRSWFHFTGAVGRDARGCAVACADSAHALA